MDESKDRIDAQHHEAMTESDMKPLHHQITYEEEPDTIYKLGVKTVIAITALALANCCAALTNTTNTIIKAQVESVGGASLASWIANGNFLMTLTFGPVLGFLGDRLGKKWIIVGGALLGVAGSCVSASAHSVQQIIAGNILTGIATGGCIVSVAATQEITPNKLRPWAMGYTQTLASIFAVVGVFSAGAFAKYQSWRWAYGMNGIVYLVAGTSTALTYFPPPPGLKRRGELRSIFGSIDYIGIIVLSGSLASLLIGLTWGGTTYAWNSGRIIATLVVGCVGLVILGIYEWKFKKDGLFDHRLFLNRNFPILLFVCMIDGMLLLGINVLYSQQIADLFSTDTIRISVILSPFLITSTFGCLPAGALMAVTKRYRILLVSALLWCALWTGLMALLTPSRLHWAYAFSTLFGLGTAVTTVIPIVALALSVPSFLLGAGGTLSISARALGGIVGTTIFTAIFDNKYSNNVVQDVSTIYSQQADSSHLPPLSVLLPLLENTNINPVEILGQMHFSKQLTGEILGAISSAQTHAWKYVWVAVASLVAANGVVSAFLREKSVADRMNAHVESALEGGEVRNVQMLEAKGELQVKN